MMPSNSETPPLILKAAYHSPGRFNITSCAFSVCGKYFAFVESSRTAAVYLTERLSAACFAKNPDLSEAQPNEDTSVQPPLWQVIPDEPFAGECTPFNFGPICRIHAGGPINCMTFAAGDVSRCRLPHRLEKRVSPVVQGSSASVLLLALVNGHTEIYSTFYFGSNSKCIPSMVIYEEQLPIFKVAACPDGSLRIATVHLEGHVRLWDLWDDGNMYANLKNNFLLPASTTWAQHAYRGEACTFAWQPFGLHICLAGQRGNGVILESESPFKLVSVLRPGHGHRISDASYTHDGSLLVTVSYDSSSIVWSIPEYEPLHRYWHMGRAPSILLLGGSNGHHLYGLSVAPDDLCFATICEDQCVRIWPLVTADSPIRISYQSDMNTYGGGKLRSVAFSRCGKIVLVSTSDSRLLVFAAPSDLLSLGVQCLRVIRRCLLLHMQGMKKRVTLFVRSPPGTRNTTPSTLSQLAFRLPVASQLVPIIMGELPWSHHLSQQSQAS